MTDKPLRDCDVAEASRQFHRTMDEADRQSARAADEAGVQLERAKAEAAYQEDEDKEEANLLPAIARAAAANADKDLLASKALKAFRRTRPIVVLFLVINLTVLGFIADWVHAVNTRSAHNTPLLICVATSQQDVAKDIRTLITSKATAPGSAYVIPAGCQLAQ